MAFREKELREWYMPLSRNDITLREAYTEVAAFGNGQGEVPFIVQLLEHPKYQIPGMPLFHGAVTLLQHDYIHIVLGRGFTIADEAFVIGFTMGTTDRVSTFEAWLYCMAARFLYPKAYRFRKDHARIFRDAVAAGYISGCKSLDLYDFEPDMDLTLGEIRHKLGLETDLLHACYQIEARRFPNFAGSRRLAEPAPACTTADSNSASGGTR